MGKSSYTYKDWFSGKVYLETCAISYPKDIFEKPIKAFLNDFSDSQLKLIEEKQKEIFNEKSLEYFNNFKNTFLERFEKSKAKEFFLKREIEDNRKILFLNPIQDLNFKNRFFIITKSELRPIREFVDNQLIKGEEYYKFVHSPNFIYPYEKITHAYVYAKATFDYYNWLINFSMGKEQQSSEVKVENDILSKNEILVKLNIKVIALISFYNDKIVNRKNCEAIIKEYGYNSKSSGEGFYHDYIKFSNKMFRTRLVGESKVKCMNRLKLIEEAIKHLRGVSKEKAQKDYKLLEAEIEKHEW